MLLDQLVERGDTHGAENDGLTPARVCGAIESKSRRAGRPDRHHESDRFRFQPAEHKAQDASRRRVRATAHHRLPRPPDRKSPADAAATAPRRTALAHRCRCEAPGHAAVRPRLPPAAGAPSDRSSLRPRGPTGQPVLRTKASPRPRSDASPARVHLVAWLGARTPATWWSCRCRPHPRPSASQSGGVRHRGTHRPREAPHLARRPVWNRPPSRR